MIPRMMLFTWVVKLARACFKLRCAMRIGARFGKRPKLRSKGWLTENCTVVWRDGFTLLKEMLLETLMALNDVGKFVPVKKVCLYPNCVVCVRLLRIKTP